MDQTQIIDDDNNNNDNKSLLRKCPTWIIYLQNISYHAVAIRIMQNIINNVGDELWRVSEHLLTNCACLETSPHRIYKFKCW